MSEEADESSKTEDPTQKKLEEAHKEGQFPISREVPSWMMVAAMLLILVAILPGTVDGLARRLHFYLENVYQLPMDRAGAGAVLTRVVGDIVWVLWLPFLLFVIGGIASSILQTGWHVSWKLIVPKFSKLSPIAGIKRLLKPSEQGVELLKSIAKIAVVGGVSYLALRPMVVSIEHFIGIDLMLLLTEMDQLSYRLLLGVLAILTLIAAGDVFWQRHSYGKRMRMTRQEVKDEHKQMEGDPHVKGRIRQLRFERARRRMMASVPSADVVITNPTHYAVALKYDPATMSAPVVLALGVDVLALKIREVAKEYDIPVVENPPLARALYATCDIDDEVPSEHYRAVAEVITYVFKLKKRPVQT